MFVFSPEIFLEVGNKPMSALGIFGNARPKSNVRWSKAEKNDIVALSFIMPPIKKAKRKRD